MGIWIKDLIYGMSNACYLIKINLIKIFDSWYVWVHLFFLIASVTDEFSCFNVHCSIPCFSHQHSRHTTWDFQRCSNIYYMCSPTCPLSWWWENLEFSVVLPLWLCQFGSCAPCSEHPQSQLHSADTAFFTSSMNLS